MQVIATAGHVDHGKSTLVRTLTGMEPDRWAEERRRGMTIDLGFAWTTLPSGAEVAFVDVPGHERFVTTMLAGVGPVPAVVLVVAADEGWMPQSAEHVDALSALGVRHGLLVVTRSDLLEPDLARDDAQAHLAGTPLAGIPTVCVSAVTGQGMDDLRAALDDLAARAARPRPPCRRPALGGPGVHDPRRGHGGHRDAARRPAAGGRRAGAAQRGDCLSAAGGDSAAAGGPPAAPRDRTRAAEPRAAARPDRRGGPGSP